MTLMMLTTSTQNVFVFISNTEPQKLLNTQNRKYLLETNTSFKKKTTFTLYKRSVSWQRNTDAIRHGLFGLLAFALSFVPFGLFAFGLVL